MMIAIAAAAAAVVGHIDERDAVRLPVFVLLPPILRPCLNPSGSYNTV